jgi:hypothetical protein
VNYRTAAHEAIARAHASQPRPRFGYIPDVDHKRTQKNSRLRFSALPAVPQQASLVSFEEPITNQGGDGACTGYGTSQILSISAAASGDPLPWRPSMWGIYTLARVLERASFMTPLTDSGAMPTDLLTVCRQYGVMPYFGPSPDGRIGDVWSEADTGSGGPSNVNDEPNLLQLETSGMKLLTGEYRIDETADDFDHQLQACVAGVGGKPAAAGIGIFVDTKNFMGWDPTKGPISTIDLNDSQGGGHWLPLDYYYATPGGILVFGGPNSWGESWPQGGPAAGSPFWKPGHYEITAECLQTVLSDALAFPITVLP